MSRVACLMRSDSAWGAARSLFEQEKGRGDSVKSTPVSSPFIAHFPLSFSLLLFFFLYFFARLKLFRAPHAAALGEGTTVAQVTE